MKKLLYPACFYPCEEKRGPYTVIVPDLPGCISEGGSLEDALAMAADAAAGWIMDEMEEGKPVPAPGESKDIHIESTDGFVRLVEVDIDD